jgi:heme a synthase
MTFACAIYAAVLWTAQQIAPRDPSEAPKELRLGALAIAASLLVQIYLGALVAGLDAGLKYNTWPTIDGEYMPSLDRLLFITPLWRNLFENDLTVQLNHRMLADAIWLLAIVYMVAAWRLRSELRGAVAMAVMVTLQAALGIVTLLYEAPLALALAHQIAAIVVFTYAVVHAERLSHRAPYRVPQLAAGAAGP